MKFNICLGNFYHPDERPNDYFVAVSAIGDCIRYLRLALEDAGHHVTVSATYVDRDSINIFWDRFYHLSADDDTPRRLADLGYRFGLVLTEPVGSKTDDDTATADFASRFEHTARYCEFIWHLLEDGSERCRAVNQNSHHLMFGHVDGYAELKPPEKRITYADFIFQGNPSPRRERILTELKSRGATINASWLQPDFVRTGMLETARAAVSIHRTDGSPFVSMSRPYHSVMNRVPLVVERASARSYMEPYCIVVESSDFVDACLDFRARKDGFEFADDMLRRFANDRPARPHIQDLIAKTFSP